MCKKRRNPFGLTVRGEPLIDLEIQDKLGLDVNVQFSYFIHTVPFFEEFDVMAKRGYNLRKWAELEGWEKAVEVAYSRVSGALEYQKNEAESAQMKRKK